MHVDIILVAKLLQFIFDTLEPVFEQFVNYEGVHFQKRELLQLKANCFKFNKLKLNI